MNCAVYTAVNYDSCLQHLISSIDLHYFNHCRLHLFKHISSLGHFLHYVHDRDPRPLTHPPPWPLLLFIFCGWTTVSLARPPCPRPCRLCWAGGLWWWRSHWLHSTSASSSTLSPGDHGVDSASVTTSEDVGHRLSVVYTECPLRVFWTEVMDVLPQIPLPL